MPVVGPLPIPPAELAEWAELHPTDRMFKYAGVLLDSTPGVLLDPASSALWDRLNPSSPWRDGEEHGDLLTFGTEAFSVTLAEGTARVRHDSRMPEDRIDSKNIVVNHRTDGAKAGPMMPGGDDVLAHALGFEQQPSGEAAARALRPPRHGILAGSRVQVVAANDCSRSAICWVASIKKGEASTSVVTLRADLLHWASGELVAPNTRVLLRVRPRSVFDRQFGPRSAANNVTAKAQLLAGQKQHWDFTLLMWVLLNCAYHPLPPVDGAGLAMSFHATHPAESRALRDALKLVREDRNGEYGHVGKFAMDVEKFTQCVSRIWKACVAADDLVAAIDAAALAAGAHAVPAWKPCAPVFLAKVRSAMSAKLSEVQQLKYMSALRATQVVIPFERNPHFSGRGKLLRSLREDMFQDRGGGAHTAVLTQARLKGMGGIGKTALAVAYAWAAVDDGLYPGGVFMIGCEDDAALADSLRDVVLKNLALDDEQRQRWTADIDDNAQRDKDGGLRQAWWYLWRYLEANSNRLWLLVLDNADNGPWLSSTVVWRDLHSGGLRGHVLVTSRAEHWATAGVMIAITVPTVDDAMAAARMLVRYQRQLQSDADADAIISALPPVEAAALRDVVAELDGLPLALEQVGMYLRKVAGCSFAEYLQRFNVMEAGKQLLHMCANPEFAPTTIRQKVEAGVSVTVTELLAAAGLDAPELAYETKLIAAGLTPERMAGLDRLDCGEELLDAGVASRDHRKRIVDVCSSPATKSTKSVAVAWRLNVQELSAPARRVLNVVSLMASDGIPEGEFLADAVNAAVDPGTTLLDQASIDAVLVELGQLSLISRGQGAHTHWRVHRLLQLFGRLCMDDEARRCANFGLGTALQTAFQSLESAIGDEQRARLFALVPHAVSVVQHVHAGGFGDVDDAVVAAGDQAGAVLLDWQSRFAQARSVFLHGLKIRRKVFGGDDAVHANIATSLSNLGKVCYAEGDYAAARTYHEQSLAM